MKFFPGIPTMFNELKSYLKKIEGAGDLGIKIEYYVVTSGLEELLLGSRIAPQNFEKVLSKHEIKLRNWYYLEAQQAISYHIAIGYAGPSIVISIIIAGLVASFTAFSFAELGSAIPKEGGAYEYSFELISPSVGFVVGCLWLFAQVMAGATISLGFGSYFYS